MKIAKFLEKYYLVIIVVFLVIIVANYLSKYILFLASKKRIATYSLNKYDDKEITSFIDKFNFGFSNFINKIVKLFNKSKFINKITNKYQKYNYQQQDNTYYLVIKLLTSITFLGGYFLIKLIYHFELNLILIPLILISGFLIPELIFLHNYNKYINEIKNNLLQAIMMLNNLFKSGLTITEAINSLEKNLNGPLQKEFHNIALDLSYGITLHDALERMYKRIKVDDIKYLSNALSVVNHTGGDITKVFDSILVSLQNKNKLELEMKKITTGSRIFTKLLMIIPFIISLIIIMFNKNYYKELFTTTKGILVLTTIIVLYIFYMFIVRKILKVRYE